MKTPFARPLSTLLALACAGLAGCAAPPAAAVTAGTPDAAAAPAHRPQTPAEAFLNCHRRSCH